MIEFVDPDSLKLRVSGNRRDAESEALTASIRKRGVLTPLLVTTEGEIVAGARRYEACKTLGIKVPVIRVGVKASVDTDFIAMSDNRLDGFDYLPENGLKADMISQVSDGWSVSVIKGSAGLGEMSTPQRLIFKFCDRLSKHGVQGSVLVDKTGAVIDGMVWAVHAAATGEPVVSRVTDGPVDVRSSRDWVVETDDQPHPSTGRWGVKGAHRRVSPLWQWVLETGEPGRAIDIGCGWGWHLGHIHSPWIVTGYEPYRRTKGNLTGVDKLWTRNSIRNVAHSLENNGLFDHAVLDHVLFLTGSDDAAETAVGAAAALIKNDGVVWVSNYWHELKSIGGDLGDNKRIGGLGKHRYVVRTWGRDELTVMLEKYFGSVTRKHAGESDLFRCEQPLVQRVDAVEAEFNLEWDDGTRPNVVSELLEVLPCR